MEKLQLIEAIWQSLDENTLKEDHQEIHLLEERLSEYQANSEQTEDWSEIKDRLIKKLNARKKK